MTKYLLLFSILFLAIVNCHSQERYKVTVSALNVRATPSSTGRVMGTVKQGNIVDVQARQNGWSKIRYNQQYGWVATKYLSNVGTSVAKTSTTTSKKSKKQFDVDISALEGVLGWAKSIPMNPIIGVVVIALLSAVMWFLSLDDSYMSESKMWLFTALMFTESIMIFLYMINISDPSWFCMPSDVGWIVAIIAFIAFGFFAYLQFNHLTTQIVISRSLFDTSCDYRLGLLSWPATVIIGLLVAWLWEEYVSFVFIALALAQAIQMIMIIVKSDNVLSGLVSAIIYIVASIATVAVIALFLSILIIVLIGLFILCAVLSGSNRSYVGRFRDRYGNVFDVYK